MHRDTFRLALFTLLAVAIGCGTSSVSSKSPEDSGTIIGSADSGVLPVDAGVDATLPDGAGGDAAAPPLDAETFSAPGADASITAFDQTQICFGNWGFDGGPPCSRTVDSQVTFPTTGSFSQILMHVTLNCPADDLGGCDPWDRVGSIDLVPSPSDDGGVETLIELGRFATPFGINPTLPAGETQYENNPPVWDIDVTELRPLLSGTVTLRAFIDTWVPQGDPSTNGGGWVVGVTFEMTGGIAAKDPLVVLPIWTWTTTGKVPTGVPYGDPSTPISTSVPPQTINIPSGPTAWGVRSTITGHGQANLDNCAEFCQEHHTWTVGTTANQTMVWRDDCESYPSAGTYQASRGGWCPGAYVIPWDFDVTSQVTAGSSTTIAYSVDPYVNTCNGNAPEDAGLCTACTSEGVTCPYNGGSHTPPFYYVQSLLIGFR
jgi:hypothetical protein